MYENEQWKNIEGFDGYQVSNLGRVRSAKLCRKGQIHGKDRIDPSGYHIMNMTSDDGNGYFKVMLRRNGKTYCRKIHRLVAEAFVDNPNHEETVDHINNDKKDNRAKNLRWISRSKNVSSAYKDGLHTLDVSRRRIPYMAIDTFTLKEYYFPSREDVSVFLNVDPSIVSHAVSNTAGQGRIKDYDVYRLVDGRRS